MPEWSDTWEYEGTEFIRCKDCGKAMPTQFKGNHKCKIEERQKEMTEFKPANNTKSTVEEDVNLLLKIAKQLAFDMGKDLKELEDGERAWVSTIFIQRTKMRF